jgi:glycosyltransferase involved in cell wall biosynthesis
MGATVKLLTIIIPTFRRKELLKIGLQSLAYQNILWNYEIIVINENVEDGTKDICAVYPEIKYVLTRPKESTSTIKWRCPSKAINVGIKLAQAPNIILTCPEIYHLDINNIHNLVKPLLRSTKIITYNEGWDDRAGVVLQALRQGKTLDNLKMRPLNTEYPFCIGIKKEDFMAIGGYDEDFLEGYCFDDADWTKRMLLYGCKYFKVPGSIIHLYHSRLRYNLSNTKKLWEKNEKLYMSRYGVIIRNQNKEWGVING